MAVAQNAHRPGVILATAEASGIFCGALPLLARFTNRRKVDCARSAKAIQHPPHHPRHQGRLPWRGSPTLSISGRHGALGFDKRIRTDVAQTPSNGLVSSNAP
jgi:hypothetical protein